MENALEVNIQGIKCDNPDCNYNDMSVKVEEYKEWLNKPCPECGENLLTEKDYKNVQLLLKISKIVNDIFPKNKKYSKKVKGNIEMDGTGKMDFKIK